MGNPGKIKMGIPGKWEIQGKLKVEWNPREMGNPGKIKMGIPGKWEIQEKLKVESQGNGKSREN
jgi:hypothetical protein